MTSEQIQLPAKSETSLFLEWRLLIESVMKPKTLDVVHGDGVGESHLDFDDWTLFVPDENGLIHVWAWETSSGGYWEPPDCYESDFGDFKSISEALKAIYMHQATERIENAICNFYDYDEIQGETLGDDCHRFFYFDEESREFKESKLIAYYDDASYL